MCRPGWCLVSSMNGCSGGCGSWWVLTLGGSAFSRAALAKVFSLVFFLSPPYCVLRHINSLSLSSPWQLAFLGAMVLWDSVRRGSDACLGLSDGGSFSHHLQKQALGSAVQPEWGRTRTTWAKVWDNSSETENYVIDFLVLLLLQPSCVVMDISVGKWWESKWSWLSWFSSHREIYMLLREWVSCSAMFEFSLGLGYCWGYRMAFLDAFVQFFPVEIGHRNFKLYLVQRSLSSRLTMAHLKCSVIPWHGLRELGPCWPSYLTVCVQLISLLCSDAREARNWLCSLSQPV